MMKRIIALLLALILTVGMLPTVALAAEGNPPTTDSGSVTKKASKDNLNLVKTVTKEGDNYKVTLESWATGTVTSSSTPAPMDIILLLDQSGSMKKNFTSSSTETYNKLNKKNWKIYADYYDNCYIKRGDQYLEVTVTRQWKSWHFVYTYSWSGESYTSKGFDSKPDIPLFYKSITNSSISKITALKTAVTSFIDKVNTEATTKNVEHRVAIVGFASKKSGSSCKNTELLSTQREVNYAEANANDYKDALVSAKDEKRLSTAVSRLDADGDTYPEYGFDMANKIFAQYPIQDSDNRQRVVIMFTDGYPAPAGVNTFNNDMANRAINNAKTSKNTYNAKVYTIGIFKGADPAKTPSGDSEDDRANRYMHYSSSNYPQAKSLSEGDKRGEGSYYLAASNADALKDIFDSISEEISTDTTTLDGSATIVDNIPGNFTIPAEASGIKVYTAGCTGKTGETLSWEERQASNLQPTTTTNTTTGVKSVSVTGFNYSDEWCGLDENSDPHGRKLIIEFTISHNNYGGTQPTNAGASIKDEENKDVITVDNPSVPVTISEPADVFAQANEKIYDGTGFDILGEVAKKANGLADGTKNAFVDIEVKITVDGTDYIYTIKKGERSGTWNQTASPKTSHNVKDDNNDGTPEAYEYPVKITFKDAEGVAAENYTTTTAKFTIKYAEATVKANDKSKKATEADPAFDATVTGMVNGEKAEEKLTYTITRTDEDNNTVGDHTTITPTGNTYQNNYKVTYETGTLKITKDETTEITVTITGKTGSKSYNGEEQTVTGFDYVVTGGGAEKSDVTVELKAGKTATATGKNVKTDGDGKYMMGLTAADFNVTSTKYSKITVVYDEDGWLQITPLTVELTTESAEKVYDGTALTKPKVTVTGDGAALFQQEVATLTATGSVIGNADTTVTEDNEIAFSMKDGFSEGNYTITPVLGKLTVKPITKETFDLNTLIKKHFTKAAGSAEIPNEKFIFTATIESYPDKEHTYIGAVEMNGAENDKYFNFGDSQNLTLTPGKYKYRVTEEPGTDTRIRYDSSAYILTINVENDGSYNVSVEQEAPAAQSLTTAAAVFPDNKQITFTNTYFEKKDPSKLYIDFSDFVKKELTATGTKTASDVDFTVDVKGKEQTMIITSAEGEEAISTYADEFDPKYSRTLTAHFDSITGGEVKTTRFTGTTVEIDHAGYYTFFLGEEKGTRTGVTYDETRYTLYINVRLDQNENKLYVSSMGAIRTNADGTWENIALIEMENGEPVRTTNYITFHNTIDTGKDDYYPIIIPTIINKDTGMLNKTDHFAYVIGYPDGTVHPNGQITRAEVATIFFRLLRDEVRDGAFTTSNSYSDVAYGKWYNNPISTMSALGIITGYPDGTFKPNKPITRAEFAAIAARFDETQSGKSATFSDVIGHWAAKEIGIAYYNDWIKGYPDGTFKPDQNITRAEAMTMINRVLERKPESPADLLTDMNTWTDNLDTSKWYYLDVQEATNSHGYTRKTFNYELWRQMLPDPDWSRYER